MIRRYWVSAFEKVPSTRLNMFPQEHASLDRYTHHWFQSTGWFLSMIVFVRQGTIQVIDFRHVIDLFILGMKLVTTHPRPNHTNPSSGGPWYCRTGVGTGAPGRRAWRLDRFSSHASRRRSVGTEDMRLFALWWHSGADPRFHQDRIEKRSPRADYDYRQIARQFASIFLPMRLYRAFGVYVSMQFPEILFASAFILQPRRGRVYLAFPDARWCYTFFSRDWKSQRDALAWKVLVRLISPDVHQWRAVDLGPPQDQACHRSSVENSSRGVARCGCVGECHLWPRGASEAGVAPTARAPRPTTQKQETLETNGRQNQVRTVSCPILSRHIYNWSFFLLITIITIFLWYEYTWLHVYIIFVKIFLEVSI